MKKARQGRAPLRLVVPVWQPARSLHASEVITMSLEATPIRELVGSEPEALPAGAYPAELVSIEQVDTQYGQRLRWRFLIAGTDGFEVSGWTSLAVTPKSKAGDWVEVILGRRLAKGERLPVSDLTGRVVAVVLTVDEETGYNRLKDITRAAVVTTAADKDPDYQAWLAERGAHAAQIAGERLPEPGEPLPEPIA